MTRNRIIIILILVLIALVAAWSRLRYVEEDDYEPQRIPAVKHPDLQKSPGDGG